MLSLKLTTKFAILTTQKYAIIRERKHMDTNLSNRWLEIQLWYFINQVISKHNNIMDLMALTDGLAPFGGFPAEIMKLTLQEIINTHYIAPTREETILIMYKVGIPVRQIEKRWRMSGRTLYKYIEADKKNPRAFYPRLTKEQDAMVKKYLDALHILQEGVETLCLPQN